jgi:hypothetical protein
MLMNRRLPTVTEDLDELREQLRRERSAERKRRLHLLVLIGGGQVRSRQEAAEHLAVHRLTIGEWLKRYAPVFVRRDVAFFYIAFCVFTSCSP